MNSDAVGFIVVSVFCAGGLFAYGRDAVRLQRLMKRGLVAHATVTNKRRIDSGSETVVHYLVTYRFTNAAGQVITHEQDLNDGPYFDQLAIGDAVDVLYCDGASQTESYPLRQVRGDRNLALWIVVSLLFLWLMMTVVLL